MRATTGKTNAKNRALPAGVVLVTLLLMTAASPAPATTTTIAVFPLLDLTRDNNGVNYTLSEEIRSRIGQLGFQVLDKERLMAFMVRHRIRTLGRLTSHQIALAREKLGADLILTGTVGEMHSDPIKAAINISLTLIRSSDATVIWTGSESLASSDLTTLLGLHDPDSLGALYTVFFKRLLASFPSRVPRTTIPENRLEIASIALYPRYVKPGDQVTCKIKFHGLLGQTTPPQSLVLTAGGKEIPLEDEEFPRLKAHWAAPEQEGEQSIALIATWKDGRQIQREIGTYTIDATPPEIALTLGAREKEGQLFFNKRLKIIPLLKRPEPISRWQITVFDQDGEMVVRQKAAEHIPRRLTWSGQTSLGDQAKDGLYKIVFTVWDRAGWTAEAETEILLKRRPPNLALAVEKKNRVFEVTVTDNNPTPLAFWWAKFYAKDGHLITLAEGERLPADIRLPLPDDTTGDMGIECLLLAQDVYGNQIRQTVRDITRLALDEDEGDQLQETEWIEEF